MKTVPSLIASSTVGVAASGLAFGRSEHSTPARPTSRKRKVEDLIDANTRSLDIYPPASRPATSSTATTPETRLSFAALATSPATPSPLNALPRPSNPRLDGLSTGSRRRLSLIRSGDFSSAFDNRADESRRDSVSSRGSWIRRLSVMPISQNSSPRSSVGPDSPSVAVSHGSAAPILSSPPDNQTHLPPNKLVKRTTSGRVVGGSVTGSHSKSQVPTLRRPATSHQRSINLQQRFRDQSAGSHDRIHEVPFDRPGPFTPSNKFGSPIPTTIWRPFFQSRTTKLTKEKSSSRPSNGGTPGSYSTSRRILPVETVAPTLVKPAMITAPETSHAAYYDEDSLPFEDGVDDEPDASNGTDIPASAEPQTRARRSLSMHFSSPGSWITRSGSLRGKRNLDSRSGVKHYSSSPAMTLPGRKITSAGGPVNHGHRAITDPTVFQRQPLPEVSPPPAESQHDSFTALSLQARSRDTSSPLPPLSRLSSFNVDLARLGLSSSSSSQPRQSPSSLAPQAIATSPSISSQGQLSPFSPSYYGSLNPKPHRMSEAVTLVGSEIDTRGFTSADEDDADFQSETVFDSLRSGATGSTRSHNTPLDSMFDESPPSVNGSKNKRLSLHEMVANGTLQEGSKIVEEDEGMPTPVKSSRASQEKDGDLRTPVRIHETDTETHPVSADITLDTNDLGRLSLDDDDEDEDWTRDDEAPEIQQLSPPSNLLTLRRVSPTLQAALADTATSSHSRRNNGPSVERPKSNVFDWSEPSSTEKIDSMGNSARPQTAYTKPAADGRGGRTAGRRGPTALHIRSQSVPVVPDITGQRDNPKMAPKFGTWGLGGKGVSEEWDGDFEFEDDPAGDEDAELENSCMLVPPAIQASQESVVGHVGQIREVCLLVEDLKRLRLLAREKDLLHGSSAQLWKEAEGIIALAVPDEEDLTLSPTHSPTSPTSSAFNVLEDEYVEHGPDAEDVSNPETPVEVLNRHGGPTGFIYDGGTVRRRSAFSPEDEIFGGGPTTAKDYLSPPSVSPRPSSMKISSEYARSVMQNMHQTRSTSNPFLGEMGHQGPNKMPFDTTSLRDLVHRASVLRSKLSDLIRNSDNSIQIPESSPKQESSPAFTRVFTDPVASPPKSPGRSHSNNSILSSSIDASPTRNLGQHMHMMTVV